MDTFAAKIIQAAIMYYFHIDKVNNTAEYWGIIHGLLRAEAEHITPLYVIPFLATRDTISTSMKHSHSLANYLLSVIARPKGEAISDCAQGEYQMNLQNLLSVCVCK
uniref:Uncharacterized protein n=1 Tax=Hyaloperonospora arabidopsidis (strain Emoy2) TaxID=559515 RepID=M4BKK5_HYAAE